MTMQASLTVLNDSPWLSLLGMLVAIVVVIGLAYWVTRIIAGRGTLPFGTGRKDDKLSVLVQKQIGKDQRLAVVQAGEKYFLVGITAQNISLLAELTAEEAAYWLPDENPQGDGQPPTFKQAFMDSLGNWKQR